LNRFVEEKIGADPAYRTVIEKNGRPYLSLARSMSDARDNAMKQEKAGNQNARSAAIFGHDCRRRGRHCHWPRVGDGTDN
jgi:hypothetical protein